MTKWAVVENGNITEYYDVIPNCWRNVSNINLLETEIDVLNSLGWYQVNDTTPILGSNQSFGKTTYTFDQQNKVVIKNTIILDNPPQPTQDQQAEFTAELKKAQAKAAAKAKQADVAKPAVQAVQQEETHKEVQVIDLTDVNDVKIETIELEERSLTSSEKAEVEKNVKGMKKNLAGFKERYGKDAKSVMYATATKQAKGE